jgi:hypothetical protein
MDKKYTDSLSQSQGDWANPVDSFKTNRYSISMRPLFVIMPLFFLFSCHTGDSAREALPREKFVSVYCDLLQEVQRSRNVGTDPSTAGKNVAEVLNRAGVTKEDFEETARWYNIDTQRWKTFFEDVTRELERREVPTPPLQ